MCNCNSSGVMPCLCRFNRSTWATNNFYFYIFWEKFNCILLYRNQMDIYICVHIHFGDPGLVSVWRQRNVLFLDNINFKCKRQNLVIARYYNTVLYNMNMNIDIVTFSAFLCAATTTDDG